jgi:hypothetical protein
MKTKHTLVGAAIAAAFALNFTASEAAAYGGGGDSLVRSAHRIDAVAHELKDEFRIHYKHLRAYRHLMSDVSKVISEAHHIDRLAHDMHSSLRHIKADLVDLDRLAHHMHEVVDAAEAGRYGGHVHGNTRHVHSLLDELNSLIHSMTRTVERLSYEDSHCELESRRGHGGRVYGDDFRTGHRRGVSYGYDNGRGFRISLNTGRIHH